MKHLEKVTPIIAATTAVATLACCLPVALVAGTVSATLASVAGTYQGAFVLGSFILLVIGAGQVFRARRVCRRDVRGSVAVLAVCAAIVVAVALFPQVVAGILADLLP